MKLQTRYTILKYRSSLAYPYRVNKQEINPGGVVVKESLISAHSTLIKAVDAIRAMKRLHHLKVVDDYLCLRVR